MWAEYRFNRRWTQINADGIRSASIGILCCSLLAAADPYVQRRERMVREQIEERGVRNPAVLKVMRAVPRHLFVPDRLRDQAYEDYPLPLKKGQTISQPYIVALMTDLLRVEPGDRVFELGTGSGYQAAILAKLAQEVYTVEIVAPLGKQAADRLALLGYTNVDVKVADGYYGWPEHAPFDGIIVTAAASHIPPPLVRQLKPGGRMVIPVGTSFLTQHLLLIEKAKDGTVTTRQVLPVRFVPLTGGH